MKSFTNVQLLVLYPLFCLYAAVDSLLQDKLPAFDQKFGFGLFLFIGILSVAFGLYNLCKDSPKLALCQRFHYR